jgi:mycothiol synthase
MDARPPSTTPALEYRETETPDATTLGAMQRLAADLPSAATHAVDLPYRLAWRPEPAGAGQAPAVRTALWHAGPQLVGWAVWSPGGRTVELATAPQRARTLIPEILAWGDAHARALPPYRRQDASWSVPARTDDAVRIAQLEASGFRGESWTLRRYARRLDAPPAAAALPDGYGVRSLRGRDEVPAYVDAHRAAFDSTWMSVPWRERILETPGYRPELDLVAVAPDGRIAAFAVVWVGPGGGAGAAGQFEPVGTHPDHRRRGLARALLVEGMRRLRSLGATQVTVETEEGRLPANGLYASLLDDSGVRTRYFRYARRERMRSARSPAAR